MLGVPLWILYELSIGISYLSLDPEKKLEHKKEKEQAKS
jgi:Sec-independent protein secretion pathway component TatC